MTVSYYNNNAFSDDATLITGRAFVVVIVW